MCRKISYFTTQNKRKKNWKSKKFTGTYVRSGVDLNKIKIFKNKKIKNDNNIIKTYTIC